MTEKAPVATTEVLVSPAQVGFWSTTVGKTLRAAIYLAISAAIASVVANIQNNPLLFGVYTPFINILLVALRNLVNPNVKNL